MTSTGQVILSIFADPRCFLSRETTPVRTAFVRVCFVGLLLLLGCASLAAERTSTTGSEGANASSRKLSSSHSRHAGNSQVAHRGKVRRAASSTRRHLSPKKKGPRGQQVISSERTQEIQQALIREHYLDGAPSGVWDQRTKDAMTRFQEQNGWQTKITPDSRALIKLGLGPRHDGLLNPDSAALDSPHELGVERPIPGGR